LKLKFIILIFFIAKILYGQDWQKEPTINGWGVQGYTYNQIEKCTIISSERNDIWWLCIIYHSEDDLIRFVISPLNDFDKNPVFQSIGENIVITIKNGINFQVFQGILFSDSLNSETITIICNNHELVTALKSDLNYLLLIENRSNTMEIIGNIKGNLPVN
jgi:hypothetical protein